MNLGTDTDDTTLVKILKSVLRNVGDLSCYLFRSELCITAFKLIFFYMDRCVDIIINEFFIYKNGVLVVVAFPCHEADKSILTK